MFNKLKLSFELIEFSPDLDCPTDSLMVPQMQSMEFAAHQTLHQQTQKQKLQQMQAMKIKQEPRNQPQLLATNQSPFRQSQPAGRSVAGPPSPKGMKSVMNQKMNMNISSPPMMSDSPVDSVGAGGGGGGAGSGANTMNTMTNTSIKAMMNQSMCLKNASNANAMNPNLGNNVLGPGMGTGMSTNPNVCGDMDGNDVSSLMRQDQNKLMQQQQQQIMRNKAMSMSGVGSRPPPPEYKGNTRMTNQMIQQSNGNQFPNNAPPPPNMRHMPPSGMFYK